MLLMTLASTWSHAAFINGVNYSSDDNDAFWTNNDLSLDILRLNWADTLGGVSSEQKSIVDYNAYVDDNGDGWRWATVAEFDSLVNWFDSDPINSGWSVDQNIGTNLFFELNGYGPLYYGTGTGGQVYQNGYDHEGYTYWQFGTLFEDQFEYNWFADFGDQLASVDCPIWSVLCNSGFLDADSNLGFTNFFAVELASLNIAPLLVRQQAVQVAVVSAPAGIMLALLGLVGMARIKRS